MFLVQTSLPRSLCEFICKKSIYILQGVLRSFTNYTHCLTTGIKLPLTNTQAFSCKV